MQEREREREKEGEILSRDREMQCDLIHVASRWRIMIMEKHLGEGLTYNDGGFF